MKHWIWALLFAGVLVWTGGCRTSPMRGQHARIVVSVRASGELVVGDRTVAPARIARAIKSAGGRPGQTEILLNVEENTNPAELSPAVSAMREAGYTKIILVRPRKASSLAAERPASR